MQQPGRVGAVGRGLDGEDPRDSGAYTAPKHRARVSTVSCGWKKESPGKTGHAAFLFAKLGKGFPAGSVVKNPPANTRRHRRLRFDPRVRKTPRRSTWQHIQGSCLENPHGQRSLVGLRSLGSQRARHDWVNGHACMQTRQRLAGCGQSAEVSQDSCWTEESWAGWQAFTMTSLTLLVDQMAWGCLLDTSRNWCRWVVTRGDEGSCHSDRWRHGPLPLSLLCLTQYNPLPEFRGWPRKKGEGRAWINWA